MKITLVGKTNNAGGMENKLHLQHHLGLSGYEVIPIEDLKNLSQNEGIVVEIIENSDMVSIWHIDSAGIAKGKKFVYERCLFTNLSGIDPFYQRLVKSIDVAIKKP